MTHLLSDEAFIERLRHEAGARYHDRHPFHARMHEGTLTPAELRRWVENRFAYQARIPLKDALILSKSRDPAFRRSWIRRIHDHDDEHGGIAMWLRLARGVGLDPDEVASERHVLPAVRFACDGYLQLVRERPLVEAVASSLTEFFSPDLMQERLAAWERHYPWVDPEALAYFRARVPRARKDAREALDFVLANATTATERERCIEAFVVKCQILWSILDAVDRGTAREKAMTDRRPKLARRARLRFDPQSSQWILLWPERGLMLNPSASAIVRLCDGSRTVEQIVDELASSWSGERSRVELDVQRFLERIAARGLLEDRAAGG